jgi:SAM-dependent methyltransferase
VIPARFENHRLTRALVRRIPLRLRRRLLGGRVRRCPACGEGAARFFRFGGSNRPNAWCPFCEALERTRLNWIYLEQQTDLCDGRPKRLLHLAPEESLARRFRALRNLHYVAADLEHGDVMLRIDVTALAFPDASFDVVFCSHVLEHVGDDRRALREIRRVLRPGGWALLPVPPIRVETTEEDPSVSDPQERLRRFGHPEHVRRYGRDYPDRIREAGFRVSVLSAKDVVGAEEIERYGVGSGDEVFRADRV